MRRAPAILAALAQALVTIGAEAPSIPNPDFEIQTRCPTGISQIALAPPWATPTLGSPDDMHSCSTGTAAVPTNPWGSQLPFEGEGYAAVISYNSLNHEREYLQAPLGSPLLPGATYAFGTWVSRADIDRRRALVRGGLCPGPRLIPG